MIVNIHGNVSDHADEIMTYVVKKRNQKKQKNVNQILLKFIAVNILRLDKMKWQEHGIMIHVHVTVEMLH